jgi:hypothetical protein
MNKDYLKIPRLKLLLISEDHIQSQHNILMGPVFKNLHKTDSTITDTYQHKHLLLPALADQLLQDNTCNTEICKSLKKSSYIINTINKNNLFIINNKLIDITNNMLIKKDNLKDEKDHCLKLTVDINNVHSDIYFNNYIYGIKVINNKLKIYNIILLDKDNNILYLLKILKLIKLKSKNIQKFQQIIESNKSFFNIVDFILSNKSIIENKLSKTIPIRCLYYHLDENISKYIENNKNIRIDKLNKLLKGSNKTNFNVNLKSSFISVLTKGNKNKQNFNILHFDHTTGYIINHINIRNYTINYDKTQFLTNTLTLKENFK